VIAPQVEEARQVFLKIAQDRSAPLIQVGQDFLFSPLANSLDGQSMEIWKAGQDLGSRARLEIPLLGAHQLENAATAFAALQTADERGLPISIHAIQEGFRKAAWPGRFEVLRRDPPVVVDAAHNRDSALRLFRALETYFPDWPVVLVFGASEDKDIWGMLEELMERVEQVIFTRSYHPRAIEPDALIAMVEKFHKPARVVPAVEDALNEALETADGTKLVLVTGSIFIAAGARHSWYNRNTAPF
jgi:dihydrofolate synthase/folylpolyglutamate synthase